MHAIVSKLNDLKKGDLSYPSVKVFLHPLFSHLNLPQFQLNILQFQSALCPLHNEVQINPINRTIRLWLSLTSFLLHLRLLY